jgi:hypothetical protein
MLAKTLNDNSGHLRSAVNNYERDLNSILSVMNGSSKNHPNCKTKGKGIARGEKSDKLPNSWQKNGWRESVNRVKKVRGEMTAKGSEEYLLKQQNRWCAAMNRLLSKDSSEERQDSQKIERFHEEE